MASIGDAEKSRTLVRGRKHEVRDAALRGFHLSIARLVQLISDEKTSLSEILEIAKFLRETGMALPSQEVDAIAKVAAAIPQDDDGAVLKRIGAVSWDMSSIIEGEYVEKDPEGESGSEKTDQAAEEAVAGCADS